MDYLDSFSSSACEIICEMQSGVGIMYRSGAREKMLSIICVMHGFYLMEHAVFLKFNQLNQ